MSSTKCSVTVQVRARPLLNKREEEDGGICMSLKGNTATIWDPFDTSKKRTFAFDRAFNSLNRNSSTYDSQEAIYKEVGDPTLAQAMKGYNTTVFAYGQTGSGKTYTMMGNETSSLTSRGKALTLENLHPEVGVIPRFCTDLFSKIETQSQGSVTISHKVDSVYYEIYNDKVHDLLDSGASKTYKVREHPRHGPYVEGLQHNQVSSYADISRLLKRGASGRHTAKTSMNDVSSRSHAVLELILTTSRFDPQTGDLSDTTSRIALVDLAGSERQRQAQTEGERLKEGASINKGLLALGNVIEALASNSDGKKKNFTRFVQYRDSTLTWLLREALGGNSKTIMLATLSPSSLNYEESLSTLKYADRAKKIQNAVSVNKDSKKQVIFALREEIKMLKEEIENLRSGVTPITGAVGGGPSRHDLRVVREEPYLLQIDPLPTLNDPVLYWIEGNSTCYVSSSDHTGSDQMDASEASAANPLVAADHTIKLPKSKGVNDYHCLLVKHADHVSLIPTWGSPYEGIRIVSPKTEDTSDLSVDGIHVYGEEKLVSGSHVQIGEFQFIYVDPDNVTDCIEFHQRCTKLERERVAQDRMAEITAKKVAHTLSGSGFETSNLPTEEEGLSSKGHPGDQVLVRTEAGPAVFVWEGSTEAGSWVRAGVMQAELAAAALVDKKRSQMETGRRLATILSGTVDLEDLPDESQLSSKGAAAQAKPQLVRCKEMGLKVVQYDQVLNKWVSAPEAVAELTARTVADVADKKKREEHAEQFRKEMQSKVTDLDEARRQLANAKEKHELEVEKFKREINDRKLREEELQKQLMDREKMQKEYATTELAERKVLQKRIEELTQDFEEKQNRSQRLIQQLEESYAAAKYESRKNETLLEATQATKDKMVDQVNAMKQDFQNVNQENTILKEDVERYQAIADEKNEKLTRLTKEVTHLEELRREMASGEVKEIQEVLEKKEQALLALEEEKEQIDGNLRRLSKHYLSLQEELKEQQSRLSEYREQLEAAQEQSREDEDQREQMQKDADALKKEKEELLLKIKQIQNDPKIKEREMKRKAENEALKDRLEHLEAERKQALGSRNYAEQAARGEKQRVTDLQQRVKETTKQYQSVKEAYDTAVEKLNKANGQMNAQKDELQSLKTQLNQIKATPGFVAPAEQGRRDMDLSIQLEMVREENQKLQQKLADLRMLHERTTESGRQLAKEKQDADDALRKMKDKYKESCSQLNAMTSRADRLKEMSQKLASKQAREEPAPKKSGGQTPRRAAGQGTATKKRSFSNDPKVPSYAKPTGAWMAQTRPEEDSLSNTVLSATSSPSTPGLNPPGGSSKVQAQTPRKQATKTGKKTTSSSRPLSPQNGGTSPPNPNIASPRTAKASARSSSVGAKTEEF